MLVFVKGHWEIDPHYLTILPLRAIYDFEESQEIGKCKLLWLYHMYNPHSPYRDYKNSTKSIEIVKATFPKWYLQKKEKQIQEILEEAIRNGEKLDGVDITDDTEKKPKRKKKDNEKQPIFYDPEQDPDMEDAITWYRDHHLKQTPLWGAVESYKEAIYNLSKIIADPNSTAAEIKTASIELDTLPVKMEKMRQQAVKDEAQTMKVQGDKSIKRSERLPSELQSRAQAG